MTIPLCDNSEYYIVKFITSKKVFFGIWETSEEKDSFLKQGDSILFFFEKEKAYKFCADAKIKIESESVYDFTIKDYNDYNSVINKWNIVSDLANTMSVSFLGNADEMSMLYKKNLCACNLPALNKSDKIYVPEFSEIEMKQFESVMKNMDDILNNIL